MKTSELITALVNKLDSRLISFVRLLPNIAFALIILTEIYFLARLLERFSKKTLLKHNDATKFFLI
jgi:hypothetical protein